MIQVSIGQYYPFPFFLHRLDPRLKVVLLLFFTTVVFLVTSFFGLFFLLAFLFFLILVGRLPFSWILRNLWSLSYFLLFTLIAHLLFTPGEIIFKWGFLSVTKEGVENGFFFFFRISLLIISSAVLTFTTTPIELTDALENLLAPLKKIKVPTDEIALMMTIALRFIPILIVEADKIKKAQMVRGADFESKNIFRRAKCLLSLLVPLFVSVFRRADYLAMAMEARCYRGGEGRTRLKELKMHLRDWFSLFFSLTFLIGAIFISRIYS